MNTYSLKTYPNDFSFLVSCPVEWNCRIHRLLLCKGVIFPNVCTIYDSKQSYGEVPVMLLDLWGMRSTLHCHRSQVPYGLGGVAPVGQIELNCVLTLN